MILKTMYMVNTVHDKQTKTPSFTARGYFLPLVIDKMHCDERIQDDCTQDDSIQDEHNQNDRCIFIVLKNLTLM